MTFPESLTPLGTAARGAGSWGDQGTSKRKAVMVWQAGFGVAVSQECTLGAIPLPPSGFPPRPAPRKAGEPMQEPLGSQGSTGQGGRWQAQHTPSPKLWCADALLPIPAMSCGCQPMPSNASIKQLSLPWLPPHHQAALPAAGDRIALPKSVQMTVLSQQPDTLSLPWPSQALQDPALVPSTPCRSGAVPRGTCSVRADLQQGVPPSLRRKGLSASSPPLASLLSASSFSPNTPAQTFAHRQLKTFHETQQDRHSSLFASAWKHLLKHQRNRDWNDSKSTPFCSVLGWLSLKLGEIFNSADY